MQRRFDFATREQFPELAQIAVALLTRKVSEVHLHHTVLPNQAFYSDLAGSRDRSGAAAGEEICARIWSSHTEQLGWDDIAQHVTIDPRGRIWMGRDWNLPPASATGHNGNATRGPFMVALVGNFETSSEAPTDAQLAAAATVVAEVQRAALLPPEALCLHSDLDARCSCPGAIDRKALLKKIAALHKAGPTDAAPGPLGGNQREVYRLLHRRRDPDGPERSAGALGDEAPTCRPWNAPAAALTSRRPAGPAARGGGSGEAEISPAMFQMLKAHVIHLRSGRFEEDGAYATTRSDAEALVASIAGWAESLPGGGTPRVLIWAHGGLNPLDGALAYAWETYRWWLASGVYPVYFVWETGAIETALQIVEEQLGPKARGLGDLDDWIVESLVHGVGRPFWQQMKTSAENAAMPEKDRGAFVLAELLAEQQAREDGPKLELHAVGHSAGAIFHGHFLGAAEARKLPVESLTFLAPACTIGLFDRFVAPLIGSGRIARFRQFALDRGHEIADATVPVYDKSLLYLVSRGFEDKRGAPILGLEESIRQDDDLVGLFGLGGGKPKGTLVLCPTPENASVALASGATVHGGFGRDKKTLEAIRADILGDTLANDAPPAPELPQDRSAGRLYRTLRETYPYAFASVSAPQMPASGPLPSSPEILTPAARGARGALSIAIDKYGGGYELGGCIADSGLWASVFAELGFETGTLHDEDATREGIVASIEAMVRWAKPGDVLALHYSGHGTQFPDLDGDETKDGKDDAIVPFDGLSGGRYLIDDDIRLLFDSLHPEVDFTFFADCCHSGTVSRFTVGTREPSRAVRERFIRATPDMVEAYRAVRRSMPTPRAQPDGEEAMTHILFAACKESQTAKESDGNGWFSRVATQILRDAREPVTNRDLARRIEESFAQLGYSDSDQTPQLEGKVVAKDRATLGGLLGRSLRL